MGARVILRTPDQLTSLPRRLRGSPIRVAVAHDRQGEFFDIYAEPGLAQVEVVDVLPKERHLLLLARFTQESRKDKFVCGHDERAWFVAAVPDAEGVSSVRTALEALKPELVREEQSRKRLRHDRRQSRRNEAFLRQGEWFFVPAPGFEPDPKLILSHEPIRRGAGKPHWVELLYRSGGETVYVCRDYPNGVLEKEYQRLRNEPRFARTSWTVMRRNPEVHARGRVSHADHKTILLPCWHRVQMNTETRSRAMANVAFLD